MIRQMKNVTGNSFELCTTSFNRNPQIENYFYTDVCVLMVSQNM